MSHSTLDPNLASEGSAQEQPAARQGSAPHRRRRPAARKTQPAPADLATSAAPVAEPVTAPEAPVTPQPETATTHVAPSETAEPARPRTGGRPRRRPPSGRKSDIQLVIPPSSGEAAVAEPALMAAEAAVSHAPAGETHVVPVTTEHVAPAETPAQPVPETRRYRFERKATAAPYAPAARPERLSGTLATSPATVPAEPVERPIAGEPVATPPSFPPGRYAAGALEAEARTKGAIEDIVSALGLHEAHPSREPLRLPVEAHAPEAAEAEVEAEAEAEAEEQAEAGTAAATEAETTGTSRRRRRRRKSGTHAGTPGEEDAEEVLAAAPPVVAPRTPRAPRRPAAPAPAAEPERATRNGYEPYTEYEYGELEPPYTAHRQPERQAWDITQGQEQIRQPESPFGSPEPSTARGFGAQPHGVAGPVRETLARPGRTERSDTPPISSNQLASVVTHAIQQQTDRMLNELRYHPQSPGMTVMLPQFPSLERVGVFVDVANLLYSSRNLRITIDFGKLLEFLRGGRRLIRAHAYAPTNPDPRADQSFLDAVKGLGYRITTKNYKTFASGAKKADMDLDLCMDIVRVVNAGAVDTIVLVSGDSDFLPLLEYCSDHGVRVEVAAFEDAAAAILRQSCDLFVNLSLVSDIRA